MLIGNTEELASRMVVKDFQEQNPGSEDWEQIFENVFSISLDNFYISLAGYEANINTVLPSEG